MIDYRKQKQLKLSANSLIIKYDMFFTNRQYKEKHFKSEDEYMLIQKNLATEIEIEEKHIKDIITEWLKTNFDQYKLVAYDSRFICILNNDNRIGKILVKGPDDYNTMKKIYDSFMNDFSFEVIIENFNTLTEEDQKKFEK